MNRIISILVALSTMATLACDKTSDEGSQQSPVRQFEMQCAIELALTADAPTIEAEGTGASFDEGSAATWTHACAQLGMEPGCREALGDAVRGTPTCAMLRVVGTGSIEPAEEPQWTCTMRLEDRRALTVVAHEAEAVVPESEADLDAFCQQVLLQACANAGVEGDCTAGESPPFSASTSSTRSYVP